MPDDCNINVYKENIPADADGLSKRIQTMIQGCGLLRENILQVNIRKGFSCQEFVKAFTKKWYFLSIHEEVVFSKH